jgi:NAD(P)-dependent dehydrogenase (short-subunit alcohol dehydrogenase family)
MAVERVRTQIRGGDAAQVDASVDQIAASFGRIDSLVNNAGIHRRGSPTEYLPDVFAVNLVGCYHVVAAVGKVMVS